VSCPANTQCTTYAPNGTSTCTVTQAGTSTTCNDSDLSTYNDHCDGSGNCVGTAVSCPANATCASYSPNGTATCTLIPASTATTCNDNSLSTYNDHCDGAGNCTGTPINCPANTQCATYTPNGTAACTSTFSPNGVSCDNGYVCDEPDTCQSGTCVGNRPGPIRARRLWLRIPDFGVR
jgi:hypothetical protein